jgi:hypothetical protein
MATGDTLVIGNAACFDPPFANYATADVRNNHLLWDFDAAAVETLYFEFLIPYNFSGGAAGIDVYMPWTASSAVAGDVKWNVAWENQDAQDIDANGFAAAQTVTTTCAGINGVSVVSIVTFTSAQIDAVVAGSQARISISRDATHVADTMAGDAELRMVMCRET